MPQNSSKQSQSLSKAKSNMPLDEVMSRESEEADSLYDDAGFLGKSDHRPKAGYSTMTSGYNTFH